MENNEELNTVYICIVMCLVLCVLKFKENIMLLLMVASGVKSTAVPHLRSNSVRGFYVESKEPDGLLKRITFATETAINVPSKMCSFSILFKDFLVITDPEQWSQLLEAGSLKNGTSLVTRRKSREGMAESLGGNFILLATGIEWKARRTVYAQKLMKNFQSVMQQVAKKTLMSLPDTKFDLEIVLRQYATNILLSTFFEVAPEDTGEIPVSLKELQRKLGNIIAFRNASRFNLKGSLNRLLAGEDTTSMLDNRELLHAQLKKVFEEIAYQEKEDSFTAQLKQVLNAASLSEVQADLFGLLFAGIETSALTLLYAIKLMVQHPEVLAQYMMTQAPQEKDKFLENIIKETLRLYPPSPYMLRAAEKAFYFNGYQMTTGTVVIYPTWLMQRLKSIWGADADEFKPLRWLDLPKEALKYYQPFGRGEQRCPAEKFAVQEVKIFLQLLFDHYTCEINNNQMDYSTVRGGSAKPAETTMMSVTPLSARSLALRTC